MSGEDFSKDGGQGDGMDNTSTPTLHTTKWSRSGSFSRLRQQQRPPMQWRPPFKQHLWPRKLRL
ncbi:unnamed protein product, partial [Pylaiella littoralis]